MGGLRRFRAVDVATLGVGATIVLTSLLRITVGGDRPLWFDEVWTAVVAGQPTWAAFWRLCLNELSPPLYYLVARLFALAGGFSNEALRLPSLIAGLATPLLALLPSRSIDRPTRLLWAVALACWTPGLWLSQDARGYTLLLMHATDNMVLLIRFLRLPTTAAAALWAGSITLLVLTHYFASMLAFCQVVLLVAVHRGRLLPCWPALLAFVPAVAWLSLHAPRLIEFGRLSHTAYGGTSLAQWPRLVDFALGGEPISTLLLVLFAIIFIRRRHHRATATAPASRALLLATGASIMGLFLVLGIATLTPVLNPRYLTSFVPGLLLAVAHVASRGSRTWSPAPWMFAASYIGLVAIWRVAPEQIETSYNFQTASEHLIDTGATRLVFLWDHPLLAAQKPGDLAQVGGFFFHRAGRPVPVDPVILPPGIDPNPELARRAAPPGSAILWLYTTDMPGIRAMQHPPSLGAAGWQCRDYGEIVVVALACTRPGHG